MNFGKNLQKLRKSNNMSQEQLADSLNVSRQSVSKWESGMSYPETEKTMKICEIFNCTMDELYKGNVNEDKANLKAEYEKINNQNSIATAIGVGLILLGVTLTILFSGFAEMTDAAALKERYGIIGAIALIVSIMVSIPLFIIYGTKNKNFKKQNKELDNFYTKEEITKFQNKRAMGVSIGICCIFIGVIIIIAFYGLKLVSDENTIPVAGFMALITIATSIFTYFSMQEDKYNMIKKEGKVVKNLRERKVEKINGIIMLSATIIFLVVGLIFTAWDKCWIVFPVAGLLCAIVNLAITE